MIWPVMPFYVLHVCATTHQGSSEWLAWQFTKAKAKVCVCINKEKKNILFLTFHQHSLSDHFLGISPFPPFLSFYMWADILWYGISPWSLWISCPGCVPSQDLYMPHPSPWGKQWRAWKARETALMLHQVCSADKTTVGVLPAPSQLPVHSNKGYNIPGH